MEGRGIGSIGLDKAADYIAKEFEQAGLQPGGDNNSFFQDWQENIHGLNKKVSLKNIIAVLPGSNPAMKQESVVVSAHYDHLGFGWPDVKAGNQGKLHPGADDNATAVAILLELARIAANSWKSERSIVFVAFTAEELNRLGSLHYVEHYQVYPAKMAIANINLDTVGRLNGGPVTVFGADTATEWKHLFRGVGFVTGIQIKTVNNDIGGSDQVSFHEVGVPAIQLFGSVHNDYHSPGETVEKLDIKGILQVTSVVKESIEYLAARPDPLTSTLSNTNRTAQPTRPRQGRKVSLGTVPDFNYPGPGVLISGTTPGSPAEQVGLKAKDVIVKINQTDIKDLRTFGGILRNLKPGDEITITVKRNDQLFVKTTKLKPR